MSYLLLNVAQKCSAVISQVAFCEMNGKEAVGTGGFTNIASTNDRVAQLLVAIGIAMDEGILNESAVTKRVQFLLENRRVLANANVDAKL